MVFAALVVSLSACGHSAARSNGPSRSISKPTPTPSKPSPTPSKPRPTATRDTFTAHEVLTVLKTRYGVDYPLGDACPDGVAYNDPSCGQQLTRLNQIGHALAKVVKELHLTASNAKSLLDSAHILSKDVSNIQGLGCYGLGTQPPRNSPQALESLCPTLGRLAMVEYLSLETATDNM